ncbi:hypothetical protein QO000_000154 [Alkalihalobacillus hemicentroti]|uniref:Uncharacterized protein n=1 Tax=Guptibacillus hwajinpoensis TaxID=208199 RepID=A0ABU0JVT7_9BACL|nr:hypothetical protein [Alkalihalobacillus hemicentroti]
MVILKKIKMIVKMKSDRDPGRCSWTRKAETSV